MSDIVEGVLCNAQVGWIFVSQLQFDPHIQHNAVMTVLQYAGARSLEESLVHVVVEARRAAPAILYLPHVQVGDDAGKYRHDNNS